MRDQRSLLLLLAATVATAGEGRAQITANQAYKAVEPCRIVDTRLATPAEPLSPNVERAFNVVGGTSLVAQGGNPSGCGIPGYGGVPTANRPRVQAVMMSFIAVAPAGTGNLRAWPSGPPPNASVLNYTAGITVANGVIVPLDQDGTPGADLRVRADVAATHLVIDVLGYFSERHPMAGDGRPGAGVWNASSDPAVFDLCVGPTGSSFSLSYAVVQAEGARAACEAGWWVCSRAERGLVPCDTQRPNTFADYFACDGSAVDLAPNAHKGWLSDIMPEAGGTGNPHAVQFEVSLETGHIVSHPNCFTLPVWCCTW